MLNHAESENHHRSPLQPTAASPLRPTAASPTAASIVLPWLVHWAAVVLFGAALQASLASALSAADVELQDGDRVVVLGSGLWERAQRYGYLETELTRRWPEKSVTYRNLAWSGDTVFGDSWVYSLSHPNHEVRRDQVYQVVEQQYPSLILIGYGAIEAYAGDAGQSAWEAGLRKMIDRLGETTSARIVLVTSPLQEAADSEGEAYNASLSKYMAIMRRIAAEKKLPVVDLAEAVAEYRSGHPNQRLTVNGLHFSEAGYRVLARLLGRACGWDEPAWSATLDAANLHLQATATEPGEVARDGDRLTFSLTDRQLPEPRDRGQPAAIETERKLTINNLPAGSFTLYTDGVEVLTANHSEFAAGVQLASGPAYERAEALRQVVQEKNRLFFTRWRPENEVYLRGFRRREQGRNTIELPLFDPLIQKQEQEIARLRRPETDYYHLIPAAPRSDRGPATSPDPDPALELASFELPSGFQASLFAAEPMIANPICMNWDTSGRLWVATSRIYPQLKPGEKADDQIVVLEDTDGDGKADRRTVFADGLLVPTSVVPGHGGVYVANSTELVHLSDTDGDGRADQTRVVLSGFGTEDTHQILHAFRWGPSGRLYFNQSVLIHSHVETPAGVRRLAGGGVWEFDPDTNSLELYTRGMVNPWGNQFDEWGQSFATDGAYGEGINYIWPGAAFYWAAGVPRILKGLNPGQPKECGLEIISGRHFPEAWRGRFVTADFRAHRIVSFALSDSKSGYFSEQKDDLISSNHDAFRPVDLKMGPDGALYICDWYNPIINHGEVDFRDPRRDRQHGRIWRVTAEGRPLLQNPRPAALPVAELVASLEAPEQWTRDMARREMIARPRWEVVAALGDWIAQLDVEDASYEHRRLEALWAYEIVDAVPADYLKDLLHTADHRVRAAAVRVLSHTGEAIPDAVSLLEEAVIDDHPRVRLEAINALRVVGTLAAFEASLSALDHPVDEQIDFALWVTVRELEPQWLPAFEAGKVSFGGDPGRVAFVLAASEKTRLLEPLIERFRDGTLADSFRNRVAELIAAAGSAEDLELLLSEALRDGDNQAYWLGLLVSAARDRGLAPDSGLSAIRGLVDDEPLATELLGLWRLPGAPPVLIDLAGDTAQPAAIRGAAISALANFSSAVSGPPLAELAESGQPEAMRATAVAALAKVDVARAAELAAAALGSLDRERAESIYDAFLQQADGPAALATAVASRPLPQAIAALGISKSALLGDRATELVAALRAAGGAGPTRSSLLGASWNRLLAEVSVQGDVAAGERVYRRASLGCVKCHAVGGAGGKVGPDLMSLGASAPLDYVAESLVHPSRKIKEGYEASLVLLDDGRVLTGMLLGEVGDHFLLRDAENTVIKLPQERIDETITQSVSLMPPGLTDSLNDQEFIDLVRFLTEIGRSESYRVPTTETVRVWQTPGGFTNGRPVNWTTVFSRVGGDLPLADLPATAGAPSRLLRFRIDVHRAGRIGFEIDTAAAVQVAIDGQAASVRDNRVIAELAEGSHWVELSYAASDNAERIRVTRRDPPGSTAQSVFQLDL